MLTKITDHIYKKVVPLPNNPLREINAYLITGEKNLLIDTGFNRPECEEALRSAFTELGITSTDLFITHLHSDHCGLPYTETYRRCCHFPDCHLQNDPA